MENPSDTAAAATGAGAAVAPGADTGSELSPRAAAWRRYRGWIARRPTFEFCYRIGVAVVGTVVLAVGIIAIPFPGPGWAMVFTGIGILATEFTVARRGLVWLRDKYRRGLAWYISRGPLLQVFTFLATCALVVATLWVLGTFGFAADLCGIDWQWLHSPLMS